MPDDLDTGLPAPAGAPPAAATDPTTDLLLRLSQDRAMALRMLFSHRHKQESPAFHVALVDAWQASDELVAVQAFREGAKSTLSEEFLVVEAAYGNFRYALIFGETYTKACQRLAAIKNEILRNSKIEALFGNLRGEIWTENTIVLSNGVRLEAHGWEEEIRGYKWLDSRPDRAYLDDIENKSMVRDTATVDANWRKLYTELIPALDKDRRKVRITGTPLAADCLMSRCEAAPDWVTVKFPICYVPDGSAVGDAAVDHPDAVSSWSARYPMAWIRAEKARFEQAGLLREWVQEYMLIAAQTQGKPFTEDDLVFQDYEPPGWLRKVAVFDPARTSKRESSDRYGHCVLSRMGSRIYVHESGGDHWKPSEMISACFDTSVRYDNCEVAVERNSLDDWLMEPMRSEMMRRGHALSLTPMLAPQDRSKDQFILGLQPWFKAGDIVLVGGKGRHSKLVQEVLNFPAGKRDILNTLAYAQRVFGGEAVYGEFGEANIIPSYELGNGDALAVAMHATTSEACAVLVAFDGRRQVVLADWSSALSCADTVKDISTLLRVAYPGRQVTWWVAADVYDQAGRVPLMDALKQSSIHPRRGAYITAARGCLAEPLRVTMERRRMLLVCSQAKGLLNALAGGYRVGVGADGRAKGEPERNVARTLCEALEVLTYEVQAGHTDAALPAGFGQATNAQGVPYLSALRR